MANEEHVTMSKRGPNAWNIWRRELGQGTGADLSGAELVHVDLSGADLSGANFSGHNDARPVKPSCPEPASAQQSDASLRRPRTDADASWPSINPDSVHHR